MRGWIGRNARAEIRSLKAATTVFFPSIPVAIATENSHAQLIWRRLPETIAPKEEHARPLPRVSGTLKTAIRCALTRSIHVKANTVSARKRATRKAAEWPRCLDLSMAGDRTRRNWQTAKGHRRYGRDSRHEAAALKAAHALRIDANQQTPLAEGGPKTIAELIAHYRLKELAGEKQGRKAFSTRAAYECYLNGWILPRWGDLRIDQVKSVAVEEWLDSIKRAKGTRAKIRNIMSAIFHHAMRYEWVDRNPIKLVRQSAKRERTPEVLELGGTSTSSQQVVGPRAHAWLFSTRQLGFGSANC